MGLGAKPQECCCWRPVGSRPVHAAWLLQALLSASLCGLLLILCCGMRQVYYTGSDLTQVVWSTVRLSMKPSKQWLEGFVAQVQKTLLGCPAGAVSISCCAYRAVTAHQMCAVYSSGVLAAHCCLLYRVAGCTL